MKKRIYAISLLLSILVVIGHDMIAHHHHSIQDSLSQGHFNRTEHFHHHEKHQQNHHEDNENEADKRKQDETQNHSFPIHNHSIATEDYSYIRSNNSCISQDSQKFLILIFFEAFLFNIHDPPTLSVFCFGKDLNLLKSLFQPGANALRAPPVIV